MTSAQSWQADQLAAMQRAARAGGGRWAQVDAVNPDGTVTLTAWGGEQTSVRCLSSYSPRSVGDVVLLDSTPAGPVVIGVPGLPGSALQLEGLTIANTDAPAGWLSITTNVWAKVGPPMQLWVKSATAPPPPATSTFLTLTATAMATYRSGAYRHDDYAEQGVYGTSDPIQTGVFWFAAADLSALSSITPTRAVARIRRRSAGHGNTYGPEPIYVWRHSSTALQSATPTLAGIGVEIGKARLGETATGEVPLDYATALKTGTANGLAIYDATGLHNVEADTCSLDIYY